MTDCLFCNSKFGNRNQLRKRHILQHLPWFFGEQLCYICTQRFDSNYKLLKHCEGVNHMKRVATAKPKPNIAELRINHLQTLTEAQAEQCRELAYHSHISNFDRKDSFYDDFWLFQTMNTPKTPEDGPREESTFDGTLPPNFPVFNDINFQPVIDVDQQPVVTEFDSPNPAVSLSALPEPPMSKRKRASTPELEREPGQEVDILKRLISLEGKVDNLNRKVVDTAQEQSADIKKQLQRIEGIVESNAAATQSYAKSLAMVLQKDIAKVLETATTLEKAAGPKLTPAALQALLTLSSESMRLYQQAE